MNRQAKGKRNSAKKLATGRQWTSLTWDDLDLWAGSRSVSRGRSYQRQGRVENLAMSEDGRLLATVQGTQRYVVSVWLVRGSRREGPLESTCTCPVGYSGCKHAVAVVAEYLEALAEERPVAKAEPDDPRWAKLEGDEADELDDDWEVDWEAGEYQTPFRPGGRAARRSKGKETRRTRAQWDEEIRQHIRAKSHSELAELVCSLVGRFPELREEFKERIALSEGDVERSLAQARRELRDVTSQTGWQNPWKGEGHTPDYSRLQHRLERLSELGQADAVVELGRDLIPRALAQVEESHDEWETAMAVTDCLRVVFDAVMKSTLPGSKKLLFAIDACLADDYDVVDDAVNKVLEAEWQSADWSAVAEELQGRLEHTAPEADDSWSRNYRRDRISDWLATALENAGHGDELLAVYEAEARTTNSYQRLVEYLIEKRRYDDAERWAKEGIEKTCQKLPGIASDLAHSLGELARRRRRWDVVAAHTAWRFFDMPATTTFKELVGQAARAKCQQQVRTAALHFLETGVSPIRYVAARKWKKGKGSAQRTLRVDPAWPLPVPDYLQPLIQDQPRTAPAAPHYDVLLDMAIADKTPDKVLHWYDKMRAEHKHPADGWGWHAHEIAERVAAAVAKSHPERALEIYQQQLERHLPQANISAYESAADCLRKMRPIMKSLKREKQWHALVAEIRQKYRNRPRFMEILERLEGRTILETQKARRKRR